MRVVSLSPATTEILCRLGAAEMLVGVDQFSNFPEDAKKIPHLKGHTEVDVSEILKLQPELIFTATVIQEKLASTLRLRGLPVVHHDPRTISDIFDSIHSTGILVDREKQAQELRASLQRGFDEVKSRAKLLPRTPKVYIEEWHDPPMVSGNWVPELITLAGGKSFPIEKGQLSRAVSLQEVQAFDPDLMVISWCGAGVSAPKHLLTTRPGWESLRAVQEGHVRVIDDSLLNRPGPRLLDGAKYLYGWFFELLH